MSLSRYEAELQKMKYEMEMQTEMTKLQVYEALAKKEGNKRVIPLTANTTISTEVLLDGGRKLTVSMDSAKCAKIDPDIHDIFYDSPCMLKKETIPRSMKQLQECPCAMCQTACATILKWRMLR